MIKKIQTFYNYRALLWEFVKKDIKLKYRNSFLGIIWSMLNPLLIMVVLTFVFSNVFRNSIPNFPVYCLIGRLIYGFFSQSTNQCMKVIVRKSALIKKVYIPKSLYLLSNAISTFIIFLISLIPLIIVMIVTKVEIQWMIILAIYPIIAIFMISLGTGLILSTLNVFFRDVEHLYSVILMVVMYMSAIFYSPTIISPEKLYILKLNPLYSVISVCRDCLLYGEIISKSDWILCGVYPLIFLAVGILVFSKKQDQFIYYI